MLHARRFVGGAFDELNAIPYDPVAHRFWGVSEHAGRIYWETSPDGVTWTSIFDDVPVFRIDLLRGSFGANTNGAEATPGRARIASVNLGSAGGVACSAGSFTERFDGATDLHAWENTYTGGASTWSITGGQLRFTGDAAGRYAGFGSSAGYDLRGKAVSMTIVTPPMSTTSGFTLSLQLEYDPTNDVELLVTGTALSGRRVINGTSDTMGMAWTPGPTHVRYREDSGMLYCETSTDGVTWTDIRPPVPAPFPLDDLLVIVNAGRSNAVDMAAVDDVGVGN